METTVVRHHRLNWATEVWLKKVDVKVTLRSGEIITFNGDIVTHRGSEIVGDLEMLKERSTPLFTFRHLSSK